MAMLPIIADSFVTEFIRIFCNTKKSLAAILLCKEIATKDETILRIMLSYYIFLMLGE